MCVSGSVGKITPLLPPFALVVAALLFAVVPLPVLCVVVAGVGAVVLLPALVDEQAISREVSATIRSPVSQEKDLYLFIE